MSSRRWFLVAALLGTVGLLVAASLTFAGDFSPRRYVAAHYQRDTQYDLSGPAVGYTSTAAPTKVAADIVDAWRPADRYVDGSGVYLRYSNDVITVQPRGTGSVIRVENVRTAYPRYHSVVGGYWGWSTRDGGSVRGGGPGAGK